MAIELLRRLCYSCCLREEAVKREEDEQSRRWNVQHKTIDSLVHNENQFRHSSQRALICEENLLILSLDNISTTKQPANKAAWKYPCIYISSKLQVAASNSMALNRTAAEPPQSQIVAAFLGVCISLYGAPPLLLTGRPDRSAGASGAAL